ncbi:MAG: tRNA 2-thiouridine(34) synthase MnmA [Thiotrichaceae bacterium]|nr:tRNA 2-thiouridine(34) synthase MnmA [Thiotrichaceae bacterium]PCI11104.1 MAG: tRNA 2-thiouridine(34) synthase MnmA [Thiotrichales bacterium]PCI13897.1 MAG: tRNA 2-thiouridine(34) synthase MnmA [Thiotrichales bacterium]
MNSPSTQQIIVGMSGGVDSSVTALLLQQQGLSVSGVFMKNWEDKDPDGTCPAAIDANDAMRVCDKIGIPMDAVNFANEYWDRVFQYFLDEYKSGRTPNPDILCNKEIKFKAFLDYAIGQGADKIATGHYARITEKDGQFKLLKGKDNNKDQSYFLYTLGQAQLSKALFPLGDMPKSEVRKIAAKAGFENHAKKDSTGICFIGQREFKTFLNTYLPAQPGEIQTLKGKTIGKHDGLMFHTIGQRKGLKIGGLKEDSSGEPWYVVDKDLARNVLLVAQGTDHPALFKQVLNAIDLHWVSGQAPISPYQCSAKVRYRQQDQPCTMSVTENGIATVQFEQAQRAVTPGQSIVFYHQDECLGGGIIDQIGNTLTDISTP